MIITGDLINSNDPARVHQTLEALQSCLFNRIPNFPNPHEVRHLLVVIRQDLSATAYINELSVQMKVQATRAVQKGEPVMKSDIGDIHEVTLGVDISDDSAVVVFASIGWRRSVYFDFGPLTDDKPRIGPFNQILARQMLSLLGMEKVTSPQCARSRVDAMADGFQSLRRLLSEKCEEESRYQALLESHSWMLGGTYSAVRRHRKLDDRNIPDFTATRSADSFEDIIELKQPFLDCFRSNGTLSAEFNDSWNQGERYVVFAREHRDYLLREKQLRFENPRCILLMGHHWDEQQMKVVRDKESCSVNVKLLTWDQLLAQATEILSLMRTAALPE